MDDKEPLWIVVESQEGDIHVLPTKGGHVDNGECWCLPEKDKDPKAVRFVFIHKSQEEFN